MPLPHSSNAVKFSPLMRTGLSNPSCEEVKENSHNQGNRDQHPSHPSFATYKHALKCLACLQYRGMFHIAVLDRGPTQSR